MLKTSNAPFDADAPPVVVMDGAITYKAIKAAAKVFHAMPKDCPPLLIAKNVPLAKLLANGMDGRDFGVGLVGTYDRHCNPHDPSTLASIYVVRNLGIKHQAGVGMIYHLLCCQPMAHLRAYLGHDLIAGGGHVRQPDVVVLCNRAVRMIVEFEHKHRSFPVMVDCACGYFVTYPSVRTTIAIKLFGAQDGDPFRFGAIALQYNRDAGGEPQLVYAASIGTAALTPQAKCRIRRKIGRPAFDAMHLFEDGVASETALQHTTWEHATMPCPQLSIEVSDLEYLDVHGLLADAPPTNERLVIDLYKVIFACYEVSDSDQARDEQLTRETMGATEVRASAAASVDTEVVADQDFVSDHLLVMEDTDMDGPLTPPGLQLSIHDLLCVPPSFARQFVRVANEQQVLDDVANAGAALDELYRLQTEQKTAFEQECARDSDAVALNDISEDLHRLDTQIKKQLGVLSLLRDKIQMYATMNHNFALECEIDGVHIRAQIKTHVATLETILVERLDFLLDGQNPRVHCAGNTCWPAFATALE